MLSMARFRPHFVSALRSLSFVSLPGPAKSLESFRTACATPLLRVTAGANSRSFTTLNSNKSKASRGKKAPSSEPDSQGQVSEDVKSFVTWKAGEGIPFSVLVDTFEAVSSVGSRLEKEHMLTRLFRAVIAATPSDLEAVVYLASNQVAPAYEGMELGIGDALLIKAVCEAAGCSAEELQAAYSREGDLGTAALQLLLLSGGADKQGGGGSTRPLLVREVLAQYRTLAETKGAKAQTRKVEAVRSILEGCRGHEARYVVRALQGKLRIGSTEATVLVALSHAFADLPTTETDADSRVADAEADDALPALTDGKTLSEEGLHQFLQRPTHPKPLPEAIYLRDNRNLSQAQRYACAEAVVKRAYSECPSLSLLVRALLAAPLHRLHEACTLTTGVPVSPMLSKPSKSIAEVLGRLTGQPFAMEFKYDGERAQVHLLEDGSVRVFSRNSEDNTGKYPDLAEVVRNAAKGPIKSCILDAEVVAYDREKGCLLPFQVLATRKRKADKSTDGEEAGGPQVKVVLQAFDLLSLNGISLLGESLRTRRALLHAALQPSEGYFHFARGLDHVENGDTAPIEAFLQEAVVARCEGLMVKTLDANASYEPSKRSRNWLKVKRDYIDGMGVCDSVDLVVLGGYWGRGKRVNTYGAYLMACYDRERDEYQSVCKVGTGFTDDDLARLTEQMRTRVVSSKVRPSNYNVGEALTPDDWFEPGVVWELQAADLSRSSVHRGGVGRLDMAVEDNNGGNGDSAVRGIGLRFPRFLRDRPDKRAEDATGAEQIVEMFLSQGEVGGT